MVPPLEALARAIADRDMRLAVFDIELRKRTGQWQLRSRIPVESAVTAFWSDDTFLDDEGLVRIPLHESGSAALTNEYLLVDTSNTSSIVMVYDPGLAGVRQLSMETFSGSYPAWRMRFWTDAHAIEDPPAFMQEYQASSPAIDRAASVPGMEDDTEVEAFFETARSAVVAERDARRSDARAAFGSLSPDEFITERGGIHGLRPGDRYVDEFGQQVVSLHIPTEHWLSDVDIDVLRRETSLREGDEIAIDASGVAQLPVEAELFAIKPDRLELGIYWDSASGKHPEGAFDPGGDIEFVVGKLVDGGRFDTIVSALDTLDRTDRSRQLYAGIGELRYAADPPDLSADVELNRYQTGAVLRAMTAEDLLCIHSPPWTGSRRTIWHVMRLAVERDQRVVVIAPDEDALEILLCGGPDEETAGANSILARGRKAGIGLARLGRSADDTSDNLGNEDVVAAPLDRAGRLPDHEFDLAIVDQAARIGVPGGAVAFAKAGRAILIGDPMQSPRSAVERSVETGLAPSIFEHLTAAYGEDSFERLRCQYRMNQAIALFSNRAYYAGSLIHGQHNRTWTLDAAPPVEAIHVPGREQRTPTGSVFNEAEIQAIHEEIRALQNRGVDAAQIGVITPYSAQIGKVRVALEETESGLGDRVAVGGVNDVRCRRYDAVIVSAVRTAPPVEWANEDENVLWTDRGLNVALTRACKRLVLIADWRTMRERDAVVGEDDPFPRLARFLTDRGLLGEDLP